MMRLCRKILRRVKRFVRIILGQDFLYIQKRCPIERHGSDYGGWTICPRAISKNSIIYSLGVGDDISFDISLIKKYGVNIYAFDSTPKSVSWIKSQRLPKEFNFYQYAISDYDGTAKFYPPNNPEWVSYTISANQYGTADHFVEAPVRRLSSVMSELGHNRIDLLKMDIEGSEYAVIEDIIRCGIKVSQMLVEFHHRFNGIGVDQTKSVIKSLNKHGYKIFAISQKGDEVSLIRGGGVSQFFRSMRTAAASPPAARPVANAVKDRVGASSSARRVVCSPTKRT